MRYSKLMSCNEGNGHYECFIYISSHTKDIAWDNQVSEKISLYKNDISALYTPSEQVAEQGIKSAALKKKL